MIGIILRLLVVLIGPVLLMGWLLRWCWRLSNVAAAPGATARPTRWIGLLTLASLTSLLAYFWLTGVTELFSITPHGPGPSFWSLERQHYHTLIGVLALGVGFTGLLIRRPGPLWVALSFGTGLLLAMGTVGGWWYLTHQREKQRRLGQQDSQENASWQQATLDTFQMRRFAGSFRELGYLQESPAFPGGEPALRRVIAQRVHYPAVVKRQLEDSVGVEFIVEEDGHIALAHVGAGGLGPGYDEEAVRVINSLPPFIPGRQNGKPVAAVWYAKVPFRR